MEEHLYKTILNEENSQELRINIKFTNENLNLTILHHNKKNAWDALINYDYFKKQANNLETTPDDYYKKLKQFFRESKENIKFSLTNKDFIMYLSENNIKNKYFSCSVKSINYFECIESLMDEFYEEKRKTVENLAKVAEEKIHLHKEKTEYEMKLQEFVERKSQSDVELINNFTLILNEKKQQIQHLTESLEASRRSVRQEPNPIKKKVVASKRSSKKIEPIKEVVSSSDPDDDDKSTDNEMEQKINEEQPCTSGLTSVKCDNFDLDFLSDDDSPPKFTPLPKRIKSSTSNVIIETTNNNNNNSNLIKESESSEKMDVEFEQNTTNSKSANAICNTQDLFD